MAIVQFLYNLLISISWFVLKTIALFNPKIKLFVSGRKNSFPTLDAKIENGDKCIWIHAASLGEYEQGLPILEKIRAEYPQYKIVLTFFSPSGYEVKKDSAPADCIVYLPMDIPHMAKRFVAKINPVLAIFIKYEIWPNYLRELKQKQIPTILVSAIFSKRQVFFKSYGGFMRRSLKTFDHFFVQNTESKQLLSSLEFSNVAISGDTRFDRVSKILAQKNKLSFMDRFKKSEFLVVAGSTWPEDEEILLDYVNGAKDAIKFVIAPHDIKSSHIDKLKAGVHKKTVCYSQVKDQCLAEYDVLILDTVGLLTKVYSYANTAYVGGGFATGLHNTLEPAVFGIPVIIGPKYHGFKEAVELVERKGISSIANKSDFSNLMDTFVNRPELSKKTGEINSNYIRENIGATDQIMTYIKSIL